MTMIRYKLAEGKVPAEVLADSLLWGEPARTVQYLCGSWGILKLALTLLLLASHAAAQTVYFSPHDRTTAAVTAAIDHAKESVLVQGYGFTSEPIAAALIAAKHRRVAVRVILDASNLTAKESRASELESAGVKVLYDHAHAIAHNKIMVLDSAKVLTGSFNWTVSAESHNAENLLVLTDRELAAKYEANFERHWEHSKARK